MAPRFRSSRSCSASFMPANSHTGLFESLVIAITAPMPNRHCHHGCTEVTSCIRNSSMPDTRPARLWIRRAQYIAQPLTLLRVALAVGIAQRRATLGRLGLELRASDLPDTLELGIGKSDVQPSLGCHARGGRLKRLRTGE